MPKIINRSHASRKRRQAKTTENAANWKRLVKAAEKFADAAQRIAERQDMAIDAEPDGKHNEQLTGYAMAQQMLAILAKFLPPVGHQSSAEEPDFEELHEKPEPKDVRPIPKKKALPNPEKDTFEDEEKDTFEDVVKDDFDGDDDWATI